MTDAQVEALAETIWAIDGPIYTKWPDVGERVYWGYRNQYPSERDRCFNIARAALAAAQAKSETAMQEKTEDELWDELEKYGAGPKGLRVSRAAAAQAGAPVRSAYEDALRRIAAGAVRPAKIARDALDGRVMALLRGSPNERA